MENPGYIAISRQMSLLSQLEMASHNLANANTPGFRADRMVFREVLNEANQDFEFSSVRGFGEYSVLKHGALQVTDNSLDVAIAGDGYFVVSADGADAYTRHGSFRLNAEGALVNSLGYPVLGQGGAISINPNGGAITIGEDGVITQDEQQIDRLRVVEFDNERSLQKTENSLYSSDVPPRDAAKPQVVQGALESSNVEPIMELTHMINLQRQFEAADNMLEAEHERTRKVVNDVGRFQG